MKKMLALILAALMLCSSCLAESADYSSMTDEALHAAINGMRNELAKRELVSAENTLLFEQDGISMYMTGTYTVKESSINDDVFLKINIIVINDSERNVGISVENPSANGWVVSAAFLSSTGAGKKLQDELTLNVKGASIKTIEDLQDAEMSFRLFDADDYKTFANVEPVTIHFTKQ